MKNKKIILAVILGLLAVGGTIFAFRPQNKVEKEESVPTVEQTQTISPEKVPFFTLTPIEDNHKLVLTVIDTKDFDNIEYELVYELEAGLTRGVTGEIDLTESSRKEILLGTCSSGNCRFDEGVTGGELVIQLEEDGKVYSNRAPFSLLEEGETYTAPDEVLSLTAKNSFCLLTSNGLPAQPEGEIIAGPYTLANTNQNSRADLENYEGSLLIWQEDNWIEPEQTNQLQNATYLLVK